MALVLYKTGINNNATIQAAHVTQSIDAFSGLEAYDITLSGSFYVIGPITSSGNIVPLNNIANNIGAPGKYFQNLYVNGILTNSILASGPITASIITATSYFSGSGIGINNILASGNAGSVQFKSVDGIMVGASDFLYYSDTKKLSVTASYAETASVALNSNQPIVKSTISSNTASLVSNAKNLINLISGSGTEVYVDLGAAGTFSPTDQIVLIRTGADDVVIGSSDNSINIFSADGNKRINKQYSAVTLIVSSSTDFILIGDLKP